MKFNIEIIYALPNEQKVYRIEVEQGTTIEQAIIQSGILNQYTQIDIEKCDVGIFSQRKPLDHILEENDRIEIYRDLIADPKEVRRKRAQQQRQQGIIK